MSDTDRIVLRGVEAWGRHGVLPAERADGQRFVVDADLTVDLAPAAASDNLADTVDYATLTERIVSILEGEPVALLETLAQRIADECLADARVREATVTVHKPDAPLAVATADVAVSITRSRS
ncbi:MAG: dihydroneopterin aldolase [Mycobacteriales bacterium]|nr:dihydroneopterin aldolase [Frankia sp.]